MIFVIEITNGFFRAKDNNDAPKWFPRLWLSMTILTAFVEIICVIYTFVDKTLYGLWIFYNFLNFMIIVGGITTSTQLFFFRNSINITKKFYKLNAEQTSSSINNSRRMKNSPDGTATKEDIDSSDPDKSPTGDLNSNSSNNSNTSGNGNISNTSNTNINPNTSSNTNNSRNINEKLLRKARMRLDFLLFFGFLLSMATIGGEIQLIADSNSWQNGTIYDLVYPKFWHWFNHFLFAIGYGSGFIFWLFTPIDDLSHIPTDSIASKIIACCLLPLLIHTCCLKMPPRSQTSLPVGNMSEENNFKTSNNNNNNNYNYRKGSKDFDIAPAIKLKVALEQRKFLRANRKKIRHASEDLPNLELGNMTESFGDIDDTEEGKYKDMVTILMGFTNQDELSAAQVMGSVIQPELATYGDESKTGGGAGGVEKGGGVSGSSDNQAIVKDVALKNLTFGLKVKGKKNRGQVARINIEMMERQSVVSDKPMVVRLVVKYFFLCVLCILCVYFAVAYHKSVWKQWFLFVCLMGKNIGTTKHI